MKTKEEIIAEFNKLKALLIKSIKDNEHLANEIEKLTYWREMELRKIGEFYKYDLG